MSRSRKWCFTLNNYTPEDVEALRKLREDLSIKYLIFGREVGENGTPHLQGFFYAHNAKSFNAAKKTIGDRVHLEACKGTIEQNIAYCAKDNDYEEIGDRPMTAKEKGAAEKTRWEDAWTYAVSGEILNIDAEIRIAHYGKLRKIQKDYMQKPPDLDATCGVWIYGSPGVGKSYKARQDYPDAYLKPCNKWWDGYQAEENVIIDDFDLQHKVLGHHLKIWGDRYSYIAENKGSGFHIRPKNVVITSNYQIGEIFDDPALIEALKRRYKVIHMSKPFDT